MDLTDHLRKRWPPLHERRQEPFRYPFHSPLPGFYNKKFSPQVSGPLEVNDISLNGMRFSCSPQPHLSMRDEVIISFMMDGETFTFEGRVIWLKTNEEKTTCGVHVFDYPGRLKSKIQELGDSLSEHQKNHIEMKSP